MPKPICVPCRVEMECARNDQYVHDPRVNGSPETFWIGDKYRCPQCRATIVTGFGNGFTNMLVTRDMIAFVHDPRELHRLEQYGETP